MLVYLILDSTVLDTHASLLLNSGIPYKELQHRLGHSTLAMTMDTYSHLSKEKVKTAVSFYEKAVSSLGRGTKRGTNPEINILRPSKKPTVVGFL